MSPLIRLVNASAALDFISCMYVHDNFKLYTNTMDVHVRYHTVFSGFVLNAFEHCTCKQNDIL